MAKRDEVWHAILMELVRSGEFRISDLELDVSDQTIRRVCRAMEEKGWLQRESPSSSIWRRGPLASILLAERKSSADENMELDSITIDELYESLMDSVTNPEDR